MFNDLTGSSQYVGNWPGVTVEKKEGKLKGHKDVVIQDLARHLLPDPRTRWRRWWHASYLVKEQPDAIINIVDGTNIERNLYLTTQLIELGIPVVVARQHDRPGAQERGQDRPGKAGRGAGLPGGGDLSALKGEGSMAAAEQCRGEAAKAHKAGEHPHVFTGSVEHAIAHIEESISGSGGRLRTCAGTPSRCSSATRR